MYHSASRKQMLLWTWTEQAGPLCHALHTCLGMHAEEAGGSSHAHGCHTVCHPLLHSTAQASARTRASRRHRSAPPRSARHKVRTRELARACSSEFCATMSPKPVVDSVVMVKYSAARYCRQGGACEKSSLPARPAGITAWVQDSADLQGSASACAQEVPAASRLLAHANNVWSCKPGGGNEQAILANLLWRVVYTAAALA